MERRMRRTARSTRKRTVQIRGRAPPYTRGRPVLLTRQVRGHTDTAVRAERLLETDLPPAFPAQNERHRSLSAACVGAARVRGVIARRYGGPGCRERDEVGRSTTKPGGRIRPWPAPEGACASTDGPESPVEPPSSHRAFRACASAPTRICHLERPETTREERAAGTAAVHNGEVPARGPQAERERLRRIRRSKPGAACGRSRGRWEVPEARSGAPASPNPHPSSSRGSAAMAGADDREPPIRRRWAHSAPCWPSARRRATTEAPGERTSIGRPSRSPSRYTGHGGSDRQLGRAVIRKFVRAGGGARGRAANDAQLAGRRPVGGWAILPAQGPNGSAIVTSGRRMTAP
jgi:hypothetical protein